MPLLALDGLRPRPSNTGPAPLTGLAVLGSTPAVPGPLLRRLTPLRVRLVSSGHQQRCGSCKTPRKRLPFNTQRTSNHSSPPGAGRMWCSCSVSFACRVRVSPVGGQAAAQCRSGLRVSWRCSWVVWRRWRGLSPPHTPADSRWRLARPRRHRRRCSGRYEQFWSTSRCCSATRRRSPRPAAL